MNTCILLGIFSGVTNLKILFLRSLAIFFDLNVVYWGIWVFVFLSVNISILFFTKHISNKDVILTCFECFWGFLQLCLIISKGINIEIAYVEGAYVNNTCIRDIYVKDAYIGNNCIGSIGAVKCLGIYLQSQVLELRLFYMN